MSQPPRTASTLLQGQLSGQPSLTQEEIGRRLGVSQMQVSRLLARLLARLRRRMAA